MVTYIDTGGSINLATNINCTYPIVVAQSGLVWRFVVKTKQDCESVPVNDLGRRDATPSMVYIYLRECMGPRSVVTVTRGMLNANRANS